MLRTLCLVVPNEAENLDLSTLRIEFPTISLAVHRTTRETLVPPTWGAVVETREWDRTTPHGFGRFELLFERGPDCLFVHGTAAAATRVAIEVLTRFQRLVSRRNAASSTQHFDEALAIHRDLHASSLPLVRADYDHALDTWQWLLRLSPNCSVEVQLAALFHDVERLVTEAEARVEQHARDYQAFKDAHAERGARMARSILQAAGFDAGVVARACALLASHERSQGSADGDARALSSADALSFFSLNSPGYVDYFGPDQALRKIQYSYARLDEAARARLAAVRLRADVGRMVQVVKDRHMAEKGDCA